MKTPIEFIVADNEYLAAWRDHLAVSKKMVKAVKKIDESATNRVFAEPGNVGRIVSRFSDGTYDVDFGHKMPIPVHGSEIDILWD